MANAFASNDPHSLSPTNLTVYSDFRIDGGVNGYVLVSDVNGKATWSPTSSITTGFRRPAGPDLIKNLLGRDGIPIARWRENNIEKYLVVSYNYTESNNTITTFAWSNITSVLCGASSVSDGNANSTIIASQPSHTVSAAKKCKDIVSVIHNNPPTLQYSVNGWFLPSIWQLRTMYINSSFLELFATTAGYQKYAYAYGNTDTKYWSSTEYDATSAYALDILTGQVAVYTKNTALKIRPFRIGTYSDYFLPPQ